MFAVEIEELQRKKNLITNKLLANAIKRAVVSQRNRNTFSPVLAEVRREKRRREDEKEYKQYLISKIKRRLV